MMGSFFDLDSNVVIIEEFLFLANQIRNAQSKDTGMDYRYVPTPRPEEVSEIQILTRSKNKRVSVIYKNSNSEVIIMKFGHKAAGYSHSPLNLTVAVSSRKAFTKNFKHGATLRLSLATT
jgi:hypothetical protein